MTTRKRTGTLLEKNYTIFLILSLKIELRQNIILKVLIFFKCFKVSRRQLLSHELEKEKYLIGLHFFSENHYFWKSLI